MKKRELLERIEHLERRIRELEARPMPVYQPIVLEPYPAAVPQWPRYPWEGPFVGGTGDYPFITTTGVFSSDGSNIQ